MIRRLEGPLHRVRPGEVVVDTGGVGYRVFVTLRAFHRLAARERAALWIHTAVRTDQIVLYGFLEAEELEAFERLITVAGVGPRIALATLSALAPAELAAAVESGDTAALRRVPGVGRKTAERIVLELRGALAAPQAGPRAEAVSALVNLGYSEREAARAVDAALGEGAEELAQLLRAALQRLHR